MILVIDNYDSFTYNLVQYLGELGAELRVVRNDAIDADGVVALAPERIVISPGPGTPDDAGVSLDVIRRLGQHTPILGVCLGHQAIGQAFGGKVVRNGRIVHGKASPVRHRGTGLYAGLRRAQPSVRPERSAPGLFARAPRLRPAARPYAQRERNPCRSAQSKGEPGVAPPPPPPAAAPRRARRTRPAPRR